MRCQSFSKEFINSIVDRYRHVVLKPSEQIEFRDKNQESMVKLCQGTSRVLQTIKGIYNFISHEVPTLFEEQIWKVIQPQGFVWVHFEQYLSYLFFREFFSQQPLQRFDGNSDFCETQKYGLIFCLIPCQLKFPTMNFLWQSLELLGDYLVSFLITIGVTKY